MKKLFICIAFLVSIMQADIVPDPDKYHTLTQEVRVTNINEYPNHTVVLCRLATPASPIESKNCSLIEENQTLKGGYHGSNQLFAFSKELFENAGGIDTIDFQKLSQTKELAFVPFLWRSYKPKESPV